MCSVLVDAVVATASYPFGVAVAQDYRAPAGPASFHTQEWSFLRPTSRERRNHKASAKAYCDGDSSSCSHSFSLILRWVFQQIGRVARYGQNKTFELRPT